MDDDRFRLSRLQELANRAYARETITHSDFLTLSEQSLFLAQAGPKGTNRYGAAYFRLFGEGEGYERKLTFFSSEPLGKEEASEEANAILSCVEVAPRSPKFAEELTHRDYLGAIMGLGFERKEFGDLVVIENAAYAISFRRIVPAIVEGLREVKHTLVEARELPLSRFPASSSYEEKTISVSQARLDAVIKEAFGLSRESGKDIIEEGMVFVDGRNVISPSFSLRPGARVSIKGKGKFIYQEEIGTSRKGRIVAKIRILK